MKIVFLDAETLGDVSLAPIEQYGELVRYDYSTPSEALERVSDCDVLIVNKVKVTKELIDAAPSLRLICEAATGINNIDVDYALSKGIPVRNAVGYSTDSVVQSTFMHLLSLVGKARYYDNAVKSGSYSRGRSFTDVSVNWMELAGKKIGIVGLGNIGRKVAKVAEAFGMEVSYYSTSGTSHCSDYPSLPLEQLLRESDVISIHAPLNERTNGLLKAEQLRMMKPTAYLINMGRGGIVEESALAAALEAGQIAGAALDVYEVEPLSADSTLLSLSDSSRLSLAPHTAWASSEARERLVAMIAENIANPY